jgi:hypothetical protein
MARCITTSPATARELPLIGDPRNDENIMLSQLHMALLRFHNCVVEDVKDDLGPGFTNEEIFHQAQRVVRWHYQWMVLNEFLKKTVGAQLVADVLRDRPKFYKWRNDPYIPVEVSVGAYRDSADGFADAVVGAVPTDQDPELFEGEPGDLQALLDGELP